MTRDLPSRPDDAQAQPHLDDAQLLAYLDGEAGGDAAGHLEACARCRARAARLHRMEGRLAAAAYRRSCPTPQELGEYQLGLVERRLAAGITHHLEEDRCPHCAREIALLQSFLGDLAPEAGPGPVEAAVERVHVAIGRLVSGARNLFRPAQPGFEPAYAGVRGGGGEPAVFEAEGVRVVVDAQQDAGATDRFILLGLITGVDPAGWTAHLWQGGRLIAAVPVDEGGNLTVSDLAPGGYELVLSGPGQEIYIEELAI
jgi:hypothetical protein